MLGFKLLQSRMSLFPFLLKLSLFLVIFALSSSVISVWYDEKRQNIDLNLYNSKQEQVLFREVYGRLWDEYFKLQSATQSVNLYSLRIMKDETVVSPQQLVCLLDHLQASHGEQILINTFEVGRQFLTTQQKEKYRVDEIEQLTIQRMENLNKGAYEYCASLKDYKTGEALKSVLMRMEVVLIMARELKSILETRILEETRLLNKNYENSNMAIFIAFLFQVFVFSVISIVDINISSLRRVLK